MHAMMKSAKKKALSDLIKKMHRLEMEEKEGDEEMESPEEQAVEDMLGTEEHMDPNVMSEGDGAEENDEEDYRAQFMRYGNNRKPHRGKTKAIIVAPSVMKSKGKK